MDFTADYGLKTRQVASWFWLRREVLHTIREISQRLETKEKYKYLGSPVWPAELGGGAGWWNCLPTAAASSTTVTHSSVRLVDNFFDFKYFSSRILSFSYQIVEYLTRFKEMLHLSLLSCSLPPSAAGSGARPMECGIEHNPLETHKARLSWRQHKKECSTPSDLPQTSWNNQTLVPSIST